MIDHNLKWGTSGINGTEKLTFKRLCDLESAHLNNILACCGYYLPLNYKLSIFNILEERGVVPLYDVSDEESKQIHAAYLKKRDVFIKNGAS